MSEITKEHLERDGVIYIRQSSMQQVKNNKESTTRQYKLDEYAKELGFQNVRSIDEDLGKTGEGTVERDGFNYLLSEICNKRVGAVIAIELSRLARNGREWHTFLDVCGYTGTLIIDPQGVYDPSKPNERLLLSMKGAFNEMELSELRERAQGGINEKASRGELYRLIAIGYNKTVDNRLEKDNNIRIQEAIKLVFDKFDEFSSARQVFKWCVQEKISFPKYLNKGRERILEWRIPVYETILGILKNPVYAGAYAYGRTQTKLEIDSAGNKKKTMVRFHENSKWKILNKDHHEGYISWSDFERNQKILADNTNMKGMLVKGSVRKGCGLLAGLLRCGHCGQKLRISYGGSRGQSERYFCVGQERIKGNSNCISFGGFRVEKEIENIVLQMLSPLGIDASVKAVSKIENKNNQRISHIDCALEQARYEADRAYRQYNSVEPENRIIAKELEKKWNQALVIVQELETELNRIEKPKPLGNEEKKELMSLCSDVDYVWNHASSTFEIKKRILRTILKEIVVTIENNMIHLILHWQGGDHSEVYVKKNKVGENRLKSTEEIVTLINNLSRIKNNKDIACLLNRLGRKTGRGNAWTEKNVRRFQETHKIKAYREGELEERGEMKVDAAACELKVSKKVIYRLINQKILSANQVCKGAPWIIRRDDLNTKEVREAIRTSKGARKTVADAFQMLFPCTERS